VVTKIRISSPAVGCQTPSSARVDNRGKRPGYGDPRKKRGNVSEEDEEEVGHT